MSTLSSDSSEERNWKRLVEGVILYPGGVMVLAGLAAPLLLWVIQSSSEFPLTPSEWCWFVAAANLGTHIHPRGVCPSNTFGGCCCCFDGGGWGFRTHLCIVPPLGFLIGGAGGGGSGGSGRGGQALKGWG